MSGFKIHYIWVKAHNGIKYNEKVDLLAKDSVESGDPVNSLCLQDCINISKSDLKKNGLLIGTNFVSLHPQDTLKSK